MARHRVVTFLRLTEINYLGGFDLLKRGLEEHYPQPERGAALIVESTEGKADVVMKQWPEVGQAPDFARLAATHPIDSILQTIVDGMISYVAVLDRDGTILLVNQSWREGMQKRQLDYPLDAVGYPFARLVRQENPHGTIAEDMIRGVQSVIDAGVESFRYALAYDALEGLEHMVMTCSRLEFEGTLRVMVAFEDVTVVVRAQEERRQGAMRLLELQEIERRQIARDLHDSLSQQLVAIQMLSSQLRQEIGGKHPSRLFGEMAKMADEAIREVRTLSFALHPPGDEEQIVDGLRHFLAGFSRRTEIPVSFTAKITRPRALEPLQIALFRITQEAIANAHRHSGATRIAVRLIEGPGEVILKVTDNGRGFDPEQVRKEGSEGVGITGMRERAIELGGTLAFELTKNGTSLVARLPI